MRLRTATVILVFALVSCMTALQTDPLPSELRSPALRYFVENHGKDQRGIDRVIAEQIRSRGLNAENGHASGRPAEFDVLVIYEDRWQWDMSNYLIFLRIDLRDPQTNVLLATGSSYQTSLARKSESRVVQQILQGMFAEP